jgi:GH15 family glucan-1,4-alpha-glucosidase
MDAAADRSEHAASAHEDYPAIADYAVIGNCRTVALVSRQGSVDWLCVPHFSAPSFFAALIDRRKGGCLALRPHAVKRTERCYIEDTAVLETTYRCERGVLRVTDFMTIAADGNDGAMLEPQHELVRMIECVSGSVELSALYMPRPRYALRVPRLRRRGKLGWSCGGGGYIAYLSSDLEFDSIGDGVLEAKATLRAGERKAIVFSYSESDIAVITPPGAAVREKLDSTLSWWRSWSGMSQYEGPYREAVRRSSLTLKLLTFCLSGAVVAAPTTSLPEGLTGERNWDYRYCWLRDTSLVLQSFVDIGYVRESLQFLDWLLHATRLTQPRLQVLYDVFGESRVEERELRHLEGYGGVGPVRIGNAAHEQAQLDVYGEVILAAYGFVERGGTLGRSERKLLAGFGKVVCRQWREPDQSIWEIRLPPRQNTYSKLMCWVALDRLAKLEERIGLGMDAAALRRERDAIHADIEEKGFDRELGSYVGYYGGRAADASLLLFARYGYVDADDPRMVGTYRYIERTLSADGLLYRYPPGPSYDGVGGTENLFGICSFWLVDYLARLGDLDKATHLFEKLLGCANDVGLYAEELDAKTKAPLGNFPQAFTHVGLITAALAIAQAQRGTRGEDIAR